MNQKRKTHLCVGARAACACARVRADTGPASEVAARVRQLAGQFLDYAVQHGIAEGLSLIVEHEAQFMAAALFSVYQAVCAAQQRLPSAALTPALLFDASGKVFWTMQPFICVCPLACHHPPQRSCSHSLSALACSRGAQSGLGSTTHARRSCATQSRLPKSRSDNTKQLALVEPVRACVSVRACSRPYVFCLNARTPSSPLNSPLSPIIHPQRRRRHRSASSFPPPLGYLPSRRSVLRCRRF